MFDLQLIDATLHTAIVDAKAMLEKRRVDYAGYPELASIAELEEELADAKRARAEFAKLRKAIEEAPSKRLEWSDFNRGLSLDDYAPPGIDVNAYADELEARLTGARVLLVKADAKQT